MPISDYDLMQKVLLLHPGTMCAVAGPNIVRSSECILGPVLVLENAGWTESDHPSSLRTMVKADIHSYAAVDHFKKPVSPDFIGLMFMIRYIFLYNP